MRLVFLFVLVFAQDVHCDPGRKFLVALPQMIVDPDKAPACSLLVVPVRIDVTVTGTISTLPTAAAVVNEDFQIEPGQDFHFRINMISLVLPAGSLVSNTTLEVTTNRDVMLVVINSIMSNGDAFTAIPVDKLGTEYYALAGVSRQKNKTASFVTVSAPYDDTEVNITLPGGGRGRGGGEDGRLGGPAAVWGQSSGAGSGEYVFDLQDVRFTVDDIITVKLNRLQTLQIQTSVDLTGAKVVSSKPVAVLSGQNRTNLSGLGCHSHILEQMPPASNWARKFILIHLPNQTEGEHYRFVAKEPMTTIKIGEIGDSQQGEVRKIQHAGGFAEYDLADGVFVYVKADKPILVGHYTREQPKEGDNVKPSGDPSLLALTPIEHAMDSYRFCMNPGSEKHLFVVITVKEQDVGKLRINGRSIPDNVTWSVVVGDDGYRVGHVVLGEADMPCTLGEAGGPRFNAHVYSALMCECNAMSLTHGRPRTQMDYPCPLPSHKAGDGVDNDCDESIDEEPCCVNMPQDADSDSYLNEDCASSDALKCCWGDADVTVYDCKESKKFSQFEETRDYRQRSAKITPLQTTTKIECAVVCARTAGCWGTNFNRENSKGHTCELLIGRGFGLIRAHGWVYLSMASESSNYEAIVPVN